MNLQINGLLRAFGSRQLNAERSGRMSLGMQGIMLLHFNLAMSTFTLLVRERGLIGPPD